MMDYLQSVTTPPTGKIYPKGRELFSWDQDRPEAYPGTTVDGHCVHSKLRIENAYVIGFPFFTSVGGTKIEATPVLHVCPVEGPQERLVSGASRVPNVDFFGGAFALYAHGYRFDKERQMFFRRGAFRRLISQAARKLEQCLHL